MEYWNANNENCGVFVKLPPREVSCENFWRGNMASGVRGVIDPFDPENPYGPGRGADDDAPTKNPKNMSGVTLATGTTAHTSGIDLSRVSGIMSDSRFDFHELNMTMEEVNPLYAS